MDRRTRLAANLVAESEAYGYTLCVWGSGALLIDAFGVPGVERVLAFVGGALAGFAALALVAFQGFSSEADPEESPSSLVVSMVHIVSTGGTLLAAHLLLSVFAGPPMVAFFGVGALVTVAYNLLVLTEALAVRRLV